jgi:hypothetical protein
MSEELLDLYNVHKGLFDKIVGAIEKETRKVIPWPFSDIGLGAGIKRMGEKSVIKLVMYHIPTRTWFTFYEKEVKDVLITTEDAELTFFYASKDGCEAYFLFKHGFVIEAEVSPLTGRLNITMEGLKF